MFQLKDGRSLELCSFRVLVFHHTVVLLLLPHCCTGHPQVIGPPRPILASVGDDIILPCHLEPATDVASTAVEWTRPDLKPRFVHLWRSGQELLGDQHPSYSGRTSLFINKLKHGDISLKLSRVKLSDKGTYRCFIPIMNIDSTVKLVFGSASFPDIEISKVSNGVLIQCKSKGWYPEPEVFWLDAEGNLLSAGPTETVRGPDDLYTVSSRVTVERRHSNSFTCRVQQKKTNQTRETLIHVPDGLFLVQSSSAVRISICFAVCFMAICAALFIVWKGRQNTTKSTTNSNELQLLMDRKKLMTGREKIHYLENTKAKLDEDLQETEGELEHVKHVITTLKEQKKNLDEQKEKLIALQREEKTLIEEKKERLGKSRVLYEDKKKEKWEKSKHYLEDTKWEHEKLLENTRNLLKTTDDLITEMTERRAKLERDKEQICRKLRETERLTEETERKLESETENF
ncbi:butyrophilin subfamily 3 member A2-like [Pagrus major]|uniref:butyrophilin subfamily 3 member A2-like n=1 Tax=Pagrus major TaxID=143350 RepID=UPI003CC86F2C